MKVKIAELEKLSTKALKTLLAAPPTFTNIGNASAYVRAIRKESEKRARRLGI